MVNPRLGRRVAVTVSTARYQRDGEIVTGAGVSVRIDAALYLAGLIAGEDVARTILLGIKYYLDPPFDKGTPDTSPAAAQEFIRALGTNYCPPGRRLDLQHRGLQAKV